MKCWLNGRDKIMGLVYTEITLKNAGDIIVAQRGYTKETEVRQITLTAMVDTGAWTLVINEAVRQQLGLDIIGRKPGSLADGTSAEYDMAGPVEVHWRDRSTTCEALVLPNAKDILLGAIPMEGLDLIVHPQKEEVIGAHGENPMYNI